MRTIDLSLLHNYHKRKVAENEAPRRTVETIVVSTPNSSAQGSQSAQAGSSAAQDAPSSPRPSVAHAPEEGVYSGTENMTNEELKTYLEQRAERDEIKRRWQAQQERKDHDATQKAQQAARADKLAQQQFEYEQEQNKLNAELQKQKAQLQAERELAAEAARIKDIEAKLAQQDMELKQRRLDQEAEALALKEREQQLQADKRNEAASACWHKVRSFFKAVFLTLLALLLMMILAAVGWRLWRWAVEEPLIKEVVKQVEVEVEKEVIKEVEVEVEKEVIPPECTQIRRNGKVYVSCDGVTVDGAATISESGKEVPELLGEP